MQTIPLPQINQTGAIDLYLSTFIAFNPIFSSAYQTKTQFSILLIVRMSRGRLSRPNIFDAYALSISDPTKRRKLAKKIRRIPGPSILFALSISLFSSRASLARLSSTSNNSSYS